MRRLTLTTALVLVMLWADGFAQEGAALIANFDFGAGTLDALPFPNNLLFSGSTDGTLNIPLRPDPTDPANVLIDALNQLDGFSTVAPLVATFSNGANSASASGIDPATVIPGETVRLFQVDLANPFVDPGVETPFAVTRVERELEPGVDYTAALAPTDPMGQTVVILPLQPLVPKTGYLVVLTDGIRTPSGAAAVPDQTYIFARYRGDHHRPIVGSDGQSNFAQLSPAQAQQLAQLQPLITSQEQAAASQGVDPASIVASWTFLTQSIGDVLQTVRTDAPAPSRLTPTGAITPLGLADVYAGTLDITYFLDAPLAPGEAPVILSTNWQANDGRPLTRYNPDPVAPQPAVTIPLLLTVPSVTSGFSQPPSGWPVVIFQHGLSENRTNLLAIADSLAQAGLAAVAIDLPLHGITEVSNPLYAESAERTFNVDLVDNTTLAPGPDGRIDPSGIFFINLASPLTTRDNLRQAAADLSQLTATIGNLDLDGDGAFDLDPNRIGFTGHSLGAIVGTTFLAIDPDVGAATLANPGGGIAQLVVNSPTLGPIFVPALVEAGITPGTALFDFFLLALQTAIDSGDAINYAVAAADAHPIHMLSVVGSDGDSPSLPDQVVPNQVAGAPLSGTAPLARVMGLTPIAAATTDPQGIRGIVRFTRGNHRSFLDPSAAPAVTAAMQGQAAAFMESQGTRLPIVNPDVIQPLAVPLPE